MDDVELKYFGIINKLMQEAEYYEAMYNQQVRQHKILSEWIKKYSTCKTCGGDRAKTPGGIPCEECHLEGTMPWGG